MCDGRLGHYRQYDPILFIWCICDCRINNTAGVIGRISVPRTIETTRGNTRKCAGNPQQVPLVRNIKTINKFFIAKIHLLWREENVDRKQASK